MLLRQQQKTLTVLIFSLIFFTVLIFLQLQKPFSWDELEHLHATYLVSLGKLPYRDFFEHHHPLLWYLAMPFFRVTTQTYLLLISVKVISIGVGLINLYILFILTGKFSSKHLFQVLAIVVAGSSVPFLLNGMEYRPDNVMLTNILLSFLFLINYFESKKMKSLFLCGFFLAVAFLFLQKAIFFIFAANISILTAAAIEKRFKIILKELAVLNLCLLLEVLFFTVLLERFDLWNQYYFFNWTLNAFFEDSFSLIKTFKEFFLPDYGFFLLFLIAYTILWLQLITKKLHAKDILLFIWLTVSVLLLVISRSPYSQYFLPLSFFGSLCLINCFENFKVNQDIFFSTLLMALLPLVFFKSNYIHSYTFAKQADEIVKKRDTQPQNLSEESVQKSLNIFQETYEFYWFSPEAQKTIKTLDRQNKVPNKVPLPT